MCTKCERNHLYCLHIDGYKRNSVADGVCANYSASGDEKKSFTSIRADTNGSSMKTSCPVIPVKIRVKGRCEVCVTYMALDTFSSDCFIDDKLLDVYWASEACVVILP